MQTIRRIKVIFSKTEDAVYLSHLDLMRCFTRALRRAKLPIAYTQGFNPHPKMSFKRALALGKESDGEEVILYLAEDISAEEFASRFQKELPKGIAIKESENISQ